MIKKFKYIVPNLFTISSLLTGLAALHYTSEGDFIKAAWFVTISILLDGLDGKSARLLSATSKFGAEADSFADFVAFGVVPGFLAWKVCLHDFGIMGMTVFGLYVLSGGFRLIRYNLSAKSTKEKHDFQGLPIPAGAAMIASYLLFTNKVFGEFSGNRTFLFITILASLLMVSQVPYVAVNKGAPNKVVRNIMIGFILAFLTLSVWYFSYVYMFAIWIYIFIGFVRLIIQFIQTHKEKQSKGINKNV
ncbi:MAG TPA: CDP-diacylglycerol--serine O-phosphatidyltransferase [Candidatus Cloacimonadota bacterium]|nr:CDP-diacylglycerol--serine O-phosphatidyltransferase [Candidatus Cloacimonadota bacterium]HOQ80693.1 CDP-diacylglycerol--serine O-phosphatidyltransferase [Candidatus Cloacimonadota bacterium]HPK41104.1 CDP-diacylglycerol--serine O-phosphatidyltransferase [Candidatus Cloacimonadota bacterium]